MNIRKTIAIALAGIFTASMLAGCSGTNSGYRIGMCQLVQHEALDAATKGFQDELTAKLGDEVTFDLQNASGDSANCATITNQFVSDNVDLIFANATASLQSSVAATINIPIVGTSITDYATALDLDSWNGKTGINVTGTSDLAPLNEQAAMFKELLPNAKNIGILFCSSEANSKYQVDIITEELEKLGYTCTAYAFADSNDVATVVTTACNDSDALYVPTDNTAAANAEIIANIAGPANTPVITGEEGPCRICGIATLSIDYYSIGKIAGEMAYEILVNGADPAEMEIKYADGLTKKYNPELAQQLGITIPEGYEPLDVAE